MLRLVDEADDGNRGRRINRPGGALIVERAIAAGDRRVEGLGNRRPDRARIPKSARTTRLGPGCHVEIVGRAERNRAGAGEVAAGFGHGGFRAFVGIEINVTAVAIHGHGDQVFQNGRVADFGGEFRTHHGQRIRLDADDRRVAAGQDDRAVAHLMIVLAIDPVLRSDAREREQLFKRRTWDSFDEWVVGRIENAIERMPALPLM